MPVWTPRVKTIQDMIDEERARVEALRLQRRTIGEWRPPTAEPVSPIAETIPFAETPAQEPFMPRATPQMERFTPTTEQQPWQPHVMPSPAMPQITTPTPAVLKPEVAKKEAEPVSVPFWQRALEVFATPFVWVEENIIKPGLAVAGTAAGFVSEVKRLPGEDYFEWKKRSWADWESPGIDVNIPWSDDPWRVDIRGVMELAPWLLIPGAGQVGTGTRAARGVAGALTKLGKGASVATRLGTLGKFDLPTGAIKALDIAGRGIGQVVEYSPWGLVEKTAGVAIKGGIRATGKISERVSTAVGEKLFGKYVPPPIPESVVKFTKYAEEVIKPTRRAFEKAKSPVLRARQEARVAEVQAAYKRGEFPLSELRARADIARSGALKPEFALTREATAARKIKDIADVQARVKSGELSVASGKALVTKINKSPMYTPIAIGEVASQREINALEREMQSAYGSSISFRNDLVYGHSRNYWQGGAPDLIIGTKGLSANEIKAVTLHEYAHSIRRTEGLTNLTPEQFSKLGENVGAEVDAWLWTIKEARRLGVDVSEFSHLIPEDIKIFNILASEGISTNILTRVEAKEMHDMIISGVQNHLLEQKNADAFIELVMAGKLPEPKVLREWGKVFGLDFAKAVGALKGMSPDKVTKFIDTLNIGRALQASLDLSGTARQGLILTLLHPTQAPKWFGRQVKALFSEKWAAEIDDAMRAKPQFNEVMAKTGAYIAPLREATIHTGEELFASKAARRIPGIRRSERAFVTYLNQARWTALEQGYNIMKMQKATDAELKLLGSFIDYASGRGTIPKSLERFAPVLNAMLFSPRLQAATLQLPRQIGRMLLSKNPYMRKEAAKALIAFVGGGASLLGLLHATGNKVEIDPRSGDFGKIKIGETRLDIWRGYLQYTRFAAQMLTGERGSAYGNMNKAQRGEIVSRFLQSKSSPAAGIMIDLFRNETYMGKPIFKDTTGFSRVAMERVLPLALQDVIDAMEQSGINGLWVAAPVTIGIGALTYVNDLVRVKEKIAREMGYETWDEIDPKTQREIQNRNVELQIAYIDLDRQVMGTAWGDYRNAGKAIEDVFKENIELATDQYRASLDLNKGITFRGKVTDAFTERRGGYAAREKEDRFEEIARRNKIEDPAVARVKVGPEQTAIRIYNDALHGEDMHDEFGDYRFDEAEIRKQQLRRQLGEEMFNYVEEYRGLKYEDLPPEYQELARAKIVMRPYWKVQDDVIRLFGKGFADSPRGQSFISKQRKLKRLQNPEIEKYYQMFYART